MSKILEQSTIKYVIENYNNLSIKDLIKNTNLSAPTITKIAKNNSLKIKSAKKYNVNEDYFKLINTEEKAYWLGFLYADGYVRMHKGRSAELRLKLGIKDKKHIELFKKCINSTHPIKDISTSVIVNGINHTSLCSTFSVNSKKIVTDLFNIGCVNNKSFIVKMPLIDNLYLRHFIRGYFDGDGCIHKKLNENSNSITITSGSLLMLEQIQNILKEKLEQQN